MITQEEEDILRLMINELKTRNKLNEANLVMGEAIRAEFRAIDQRIRAENSANIAVLQAEARAAETALKEGAK